jgi:metal-dependent hydrolase (beta-lactamase superfamily II)
MPVIGGMHHVQASRARIGHTITALRGHNVQRIGPAHCTGREASSEGWEALADRCLACSVDTQIAL